MTISDRILKLRKEAGFSQESLAEKLGVSRQSISKWESGNVMPDIDNVIAMCEIFGVSTDYLLTGESKEPEVQTEEYAQSNTETQKIEFCSTSQVAEEAAVTTEKKTKKPRGKTGKIIACVLAVCLVVTALIPIPTGGYRRLWARLTEDPVEYPYVLVHGMGGWGESAAINSVAPYWGSTSGSISDNLRSKNIKVLEATVGPFSSAWDRACELYAQLTGTTVDYGAAHSAEHGHERYGKSYDNALYANWGKKTEGGQLQKINLVGHSFGGNTVRLLTSLLEYGNEAEQQASPDNVSELFTGGKGEYINSVTTLCSPHNGSTLYYVVDQQNLIPSALGMLQAAGGITDILTGGEIDFQLEHFGILSDSDDAMSLINDSFMSGKDNAFFDLSPHGAAALNKTIRTVDSVYYFSYSYCTTEKSPLSDNQIPTASTMLVLMPIATLIGRYTNISESAPVKIDNEWLPNDGLVNVISAKSPKGEEAEEYNEESKIVRGKWYVFPTLPGDHGTVIGMNGDAQKTHQFYTDLTAMIDALPRIR